MKPRPVRVYLPDRELETTRRRTVAWKLTCKACGAEVRGKRYGDVRTKMREHKATAHANQPAPTG